MNFTKNFKLANTRLWKHNWRVRLKEWWGDLRFALPVVYSDGLISKSKKYLIGRTPVGIMVGNVIVLLNIPKETKTFAEAELFCDNIWFAGRKAVVGRFNQMCRINRRINDFCDVYFELTQQRFIRDYFWTRDFLSQRERRVLHMNGMPTYYTYSARPDKDLYVMPVIDLKDFSTLLRVAS